MFVSPLKQIKQKINLHRHQVYRFKPQLIFSVEMGPYVIKTAESTAELVDSFRLRNEVFNQEFRGLKNTLLDFDRYDSLFDHLIIKHIETQKIVGTYRLRVHQELERTYTSEEFDLSPLQVEKGPYLELGRACIHKDHRRGSVIALLWRGIAEYMNRSGAETLFGCSSLKINDPEMAALVYNYLEQRDGLSPWQTTTTPDFTFHDFDSYIRFTKDKVDENSIRLIEESIPPLLKSYLKLGALIAAPPAYDRDFDCIDLLTVLKKSSLSQKLERKFNVQKSDEKSDTRP